MSRPADGYTFELSDTVTRTPVRYRNRFDVAIAADLYRRVDSTGRSPIRPSSSDRRMAA
jgi:hypothetical protein